MPYIRDNYKKKIQKNKKANLLKNDLNPEKLDLNFLSLNFPNLNDPRFREIAETGQLRRKKNFQLIRKSLLNTLSRIFSLKLTLKEVLI